MENERNVADLYSRLDDISKSLVSKIDRNTGVLPIKNLFLEGGLNLGNLGDITEFLKMVSHTSNGFMYMEDKEKLDGIEAGSNKYIHPDTHPAAMIVETAIRRFVTDIQIAAWDSKAEGIHNHHDLYYTKNEVNVELNKKANNVHGIHLPELEPEDNTRFLRNDNTWQQIIPNNIGALNTDGSNHMQTSLKILPIFSSDSNIKIYKAKSDIKVNTFMEVGLRGTDNEEPIIGYNEDGGLVRYLRLRKDGKMMYMPTMAGDEYEVFHTGNFDPSTKLDKGTYTGNASDLKTLIDGKAPTVHGFHIPEPQSVDRLKFLGNDNVWRFLPDATTTLKGVVRLEDDETSSSLVTAPTSNALLKTFNQLNELKVNKAGDSMTGALDFSSRNTGVVDIITRSKNKSGLHTAAILKTYDTLNDLGDGVILKSEAGLILGSGSSTDHWGSLMPNAWTKDTILMSEDKIRLVSNVSTSATNKVEVTFDKSGLLDTPILRSRTRMYIDNIFDVDTTKFTYKGKPVLHEDNYANYIQPGAINVYSKEESDARFVQIVGNTVPIGDKEFKLSKTLAVRSTRMKRSLDTPMPIAENVIHGGMNISEDGMDIKTNYSANVVINNDDIGEGVFRIQHGSGRINLLEVNTSGILWKNRFEVLHTGLLDPNNVAAKEHGYHVPTPETVNNARFLRNDNTWQLVTPNNIGALNTDGSNVMTNTLKITSIYSNYQGIKLIKGGEGADSQNHIQLGYATTEEPIFGYAGAGSWKRYIRMKTDGKLIFMPSQGSAEKEVYHTGNIFNATQTVAGFMSMGDKKKLDGIETGANKYIHPETHLSTMIVDTADKRFVTDVQIAAWNAKAETTLVTQNSNGLMSKEDKVRLDGMETGANRYTHPDTHSANMIVENSSRKFVTDAQIAAWNAKAETTLATSSNNGLMSNADKAKLDGIANNANNYVHPDSHPASIIVESSTKKFVSQVQIDDWNSKANGSHGNHVPTVETVNVAKFLRNDNTWQLVTPNNIGTYTSQEIDTELNKKANNVHGVHIPTPETANNAKFLRNDNTWFLVTPGNIGAVNKSGDIVDGSNIIFNTQTDTKPLTITRQGNTIAESLRIGISDAKTLFNYTNDEATATMEFRINNTDTELPATGTNANVTTFSIVGSKTPSVKLNGWTFWHTGNFDPASKAEKEHGNHVPLVESVNDARFLRNDNTWADILPENINAISTNTNDHKVGRLQITRPTTIGGSLPSDLSNAWLLVGTPTNGIGFDDNEIACNSDYLIIHAKNYMSLRLAGVERVKIQSDAMLINGKKVWHEGTFDPASKANASHGNHVPTTETANNAKFLRNDNTWQLVTPGNIGAVNKAGDTMTGTLNLMDSHTALNIGGLRLGTGHNNRAIIYAATDSASTSAGWVFRTLTGGTGRNDRVIIDSNSGEIFAVDGTKKVWHSDSFNPSSKLDKGTYTGNASDLKSLIDGKAPTVHGVHIPTPETVIDKARFLRSDNTWQNVLPVNIGTYDKNEIDNLIAGLINDIDWKEAVETYDDILTTYPNPQDGWTVNVKDTNITYRFDGTEWISISTNSMTKVTHDADGLMSKEDKVRLDLIEDGANNYVHPSKHDASMITESSSKRFVTDVQIAAWNAKAETTLVTTSTNGLMRKEDKSKLDGIDVNANNYVHPESHPASMIIESSTKKFVTAEQILSWDSKPTSSLATPTLNGLMPKEDKAKLDSMTPLPKNAVKGNILVHNGTETTWGNRIENDLEVTGKVKTTTLELGGKISIGYNSTSDSIDFNFI